MSRPKILTPRTSWHSTVEPLYGADSEYAHRIGPLMGDAGQYPYTRGIHRDMYRNRLWTMRQYAGFGDATQTNVRFQYLLQQGQTGLSVAFDLPTQIGLDSDDPRAAGEVGRVGVAIDSLEDMEALFRGVPLNKISTSMTINSTAAVLLAMYIAAAKKQGVSPKELRGTTQNDILKEYIARGTHIYPPEPSLRLVVDLMEYCASELPEWNTVSISGYHIREAGSTPVQEVAFTLADAKTYVERARMRGLNPDSIGPRISFFFNSHNRIFEEIAKLRAARRLWARIMRETFDASSPRAWTLRVHVQTAGSTLTAQQPRNNIVRTTLQALAAILGGVQSLHTNSMDEALSLPTEEAALLALRTQQILGHESGVTRTADPLGGAYYIEALTAEIERECQIYLERIDRMGGMLRAIETGFVQEEIQQAAYDYQRRVESKEEIVVGVNQFSTQGEEALPIQKLTARAEEEQKQKLRRYRAVRATARWAASLSQLRKAAGGQDNLLPPILECVESGATVGEIAGCLRDVFGEYREPHA